MNKFLFKSSEPDLQKLYFKIDLIQKEQRAQRIDLAVILRQLTGLINDNKLQRQVDEFYPNEDIPTDEDKEPD